MLLYFLLVTFALIFFFPFYWVLSASFKPASEIISTPPTLYPHTFTTENFLHVLEPIFIRYFFNTFVYATGITIVALFTSSLIGYVLVKHPSKFGNLMFWVFIASNMVPFATYMLPTFLLLLRIQKLLHFKLINTYLGMMLPYFVYPFAIFLMRQAMMSVPNDLLDAGKIDGTGDFGAFWHIALPVTRQNLATLVILVFMMKYDDLLWPLIMATKSEMYPLAVGLAQYIGTYFTEYQNYTAAATLAVLPIVVIYLLLQRYIIQGIALQGMKG